MSIWEYRERTSYALKTVDAALPDPATPLPRGLFEQFTFVNWTPNNVAGLKITLYNSAGQSLVVYDLAPLEPNGVYCHPAYEDESEYVCQVKVSLGTRPPINWAVPGGNLHASRALVAVIQSASGVQLRAMFETREDDPTQTPPPVWVEAL